MRAKVKLKITINCTYRREEEEEDEERNKNHKDNDNGICFTALWNLIRLFSPSEHTHTHNSQMQRICQYFFISGEMWPSTRKEKPIKIDKRGIDSSNYYHHCTHFLYISHSQALHMYSQ